MSHYFYDDLSTTPIPDYDYNATFDYYLGKSSGATQSCLCATDSNSWSFCLCSDGELRRPQLWKRGEQLPFSTPCFVKSNTPTSRCPAASLPVRNERRWPQICFLFLQGRSGSCSSVNHQALIVSALLMALSAQHLTGFWSVTMATACLLWYKVFTFLHLLHFRLTDLQWNMTFIVRIYFGSWVMNVFILWMRTSGSTVSHNNLIIFVWRPTRTKHIVLNGACLTPSWQTKVTGHERWITPTKMWRWCYEVNRRAAPGVHSVTSYDGTSVLINSYK